MNGSTREVMLAIWLADLVVTAIELYGGITLKSIMLLGNFWDGFCMAVFVGGNIFLGLPLELRGRTRWARWIADGSDILFAGNLIAALYIAHWLKGEVISINGWWVAFIAFIAIVANWTFSRLCPHGLVNCESARFKFRLGAIVGGMTLAEGILLIIFANDAIIDRIIAVATAGIILLALVWHLRELHRERAKQPSLLELLSKY